MQPADKFIGFVDIMGFKSLVQAAEAQKDLTLTELSQAVEALAQKKTLDTLTNTVQRFALMPTSSHGS